MTGQNTAASQRVVQKKESGAIDMRPGSSPYASPLITIHFADGPPLAVPTRLIDKSPKLSSCCGYECLQNLEDHLAMRKTQPNSRRALEYTRSLETTDYLI
ncbi:hypothetical protein HD806DRAFT_409581 [Xylariaceae sp. AK1471]|nr:hypothetical protein HD806DRAFT_409581 [Xylariaceae sp. AK1471]